MNRSRTASGSIARGSYIIGSINKQTGAFSVASNPGVHYDLNTARREAERLSRAHTEKKFVVWRCDGVVSTDTTVWES